LIAYIGSNMRIAIITPILPMRADVTKGRFIHETVSALSRLACTKVFLTQPRYPEWASRSNATEGPISVNDVLESVYPVEAVNYPAIPIISRLINSQIQARCILKSVRDFKPDIVIGYWAYPEGACAVHVAQKLGIPAVIGALGTDINERSGIQAWLTARALNQADKVIFVSQSMSNHAQRHHGVPQEKCATVINGVNTDVFHPQDRTACRAALGIATDAPLIVYVGRLIEAKGLQELFDAVRALSSTYPTLKCVLIGSGGFSRHLQEQVSAHGMAEHFHLAGGMTPQEVAVHVNAADLLTLPSWTEGYPNVLVEALACGCPVVATDVGGIPEIVKINNGILIPAKNTSALRNALEKALQANWDRDLISRNMRREWHDVATETLGICIQAIERRKQNGTQ